MNGWVFARPGSSGAVRRTPSQHQHHRRRARGRALGALFVKAGHRVMFSSRHPDTLKGLADELGPLARAGTVAEALDFGDVVMVSFRIRRWSISGRTTATRLRRKCW